MQRLHGLIIFSCALTFDFACDGLPGGIRMPVRLRGGDGGPVRAGGQQKLLVSMTGASRHQKQQMNSGYSGSGYQTGRYPSYTTNQPSSGPTTICHPDTTPGQSGLCTAISDLALCNGMLMTTSSDCNGLGSNFLCCYVDTDYGSTVATTTSSGTTGTGPTAGSTGPTSTTATTTTGTGLPDRAMLSGQIRMQQCGIPNGDPSIFTSQEGPTAKVEKFVQQTRLRSVFKGSPVNHTERFMVEEKVLGGSEAPNGSGSLCWQVGIIKLNLATNELLFCGGTIVGRRTVITAAQCIVDTTVADFQFSSIQVQVQTGAITRDVDTGPPFYPNLLPCAQSINAASAIPHPNYDPVTFDNDIAVLFLAEDLDFRVNAGCTCPLCLTRQAPAVGDVCLASGFGDEVDVNNGGTPPRTTIPLKYVPQTILASSYTQGSCAWVSSTAGQVTDLDLFLCAGGVTAQGFCSGDSGGPVFCYNPDTKTQYLAGVVSNGAGCGTSNGGLATKVALYVDWIFSVAQLGDLSFAFGR